MKLYIVTAFGPCIDTICEPFIDYKDAYRYVTNMWSKWNISDVEEICTDIWKTEDERHQNIEWQIHQKTLDKGL